jgi:hypothetical protein
VPRILLPAFGVTRSGIPSVPRTYIPLTFRQKLPSAEPQPSTMT